MKHEVPKGQKDHVGHKNRQGRQVVPYQHRSQPPLTISGFRGVKSRIPCIRIHDIMKSKVPMEWKAIERSNLASASECRQIWFR
jgi:hypothetical protein